MQTSPFANRLRKNLRQRERWARRNGTTAYRLYDHDIPEYGYTLDRYGDEAVLYELASRRGFVPGQEARRAEVLAAVEEVLGLSPAQIHLKIRSPKVWGQEQYEKEGSRGRRLVVEEGGLRFWVNLSDYLDTGLFLDHRDTRARVGAEAKGKRFLNLFAYTGAFTVHAAAGGAASCTTVDLSRTYLAWAQENLELNGLWDPAQHELVHGDVLRWLQQAQGRRWDLIVLDPPSYSVSKEMQGSFEIQRDHPTLLRNTLSLLSPGGLLYFSTHFSTFSLDRRVLGSALVEELTPASIPADFKNRRVHRCWRIQAPP